MRGSARVGVLSLLLVFVAPAAFHAGGVPAKVLKDIKAASVYIKLAVKPASGPGKPNTVTGSGFVVHVAGTTGLIATNNHVVTPLPTEVLAGPVEVVFNSGTPKEKIVAARVVARDPRRDLAILEVRGFEELPRPIPRDRAVEVNETMPVYAVGFPFGAELALGKRGPALTITKGTISSLRQDEDSGLELIQIDAEVNPGNSGGPVVDEKGKLIGVAVSKLVKARTVGFAVPLGPLAEMLEGKVSTLAFDTLWVVKDHAEVSVEAALVDPLGKLKDAALHYRALEDDKGLPKPDKAGKARLLAGARRVWLKMGQDRGRGRFTLEGKPGADKVRLAYQTSYVTASGKTVVSPVSLAVIDFTKVTYSDRLTDGDPRAGGKPHKAYAHPMKAGKYYVIDMRADPKDLDPRVVVRDASGKVLAEDDGTGGLYDALLVFSPPRDEEYQIVATAGKGSGPFTLSIREDTGRRLGAKGLELSGTLRTSDPLDPVLRAPHQAFNLILDKGKSYAIEVKSKDFDPRLRLENMVNLHLKFEDLGGGGHSTLYFTAFQGGIYRLITTAYDFQAGKFDLAVRQLPDLKQHEVGADGLKLAGVLKASDPVDVVDGRANNNRCQAFAVKLKAGQKYQIDLLSKAFDAFLRVEDLRGRELAFDDDSAGMLNARLTFKPVTDGVYRLIAAQFDGRFGAFDLVVRPVR